MYAVISIGGKQYRAAKGDVLRVERLKGEVGGTVEPTVLLYDDGETVKAGGELEKVRAEAEILRHGKGVKVNVFKYKPKKNERKRQGHRQPFTEIKILDIREQ